MDIMKPVFKYTFMATGTLAALMLLLFVVAIVSRRGRDDPSRISDTSGQCESLGVALAMFCSDCGRYPSTDEGFSVLYEARAISGWRGPYVEGGTRGGHPVDSWGHPFVYRNADGQVIVISCGPDGREGTADDVVYKLRVPVR